MYLQNIMYSVFMHVLVIVVWASTILQGSGTTFYMDFERPNITYYNPKFYAYLNISAQRRSRRDPIHYVSIHSECLVEFGNEILVDVYIFEFRSNEYRRGFLELHYKLCEWLQLDKTFFPVIMKYMKIKTCPFPKGEYHFVEMWLPDMPLLRTFPFTKGRMFMNVSNSFTSERVLELYIDVMIKERK